jgi:hypothetical protein
MNLGNGKGPKHTGRSVIILIPTTSVSTNFFQKLYYPRAVEKQIRQLSQAKRLSRIGPAKGGNWQVVL